MKELAIRIWSYSEKKWILPTPTIAGGPPILFSFSTDKNPITYIGFGKELLGFEDYEIVRYTGLRDKNEVKIFEGDIVKFYGDFGVVTAKVIWDAPKFKFEDLTTPGSYLSKALFTDETGHEINIWTTNYPPEKFEVIGSIYETPELLEQI